MKKTSVPKRKDFEDKKVGKNLKQLLKKTYVPKRKRFFKHNFFTLKVKKFKIKKTHFLKKTSVPKRINFKIDF